MWYDGKIARKHSNCVDVSIIRLSRQTFHVNLPYLIIKFKILVQKLS